MVVTKIFLSFIKEKEWLDKMNKKGYVLDSRKGFRYNLKNIQKTVNYEYVFLKNGKKSYKEFDYKSKDKKAKAIYANADMMLLKKQEQDGDFTLFSGYNQKLLNSAQKRTQLNTVSLLYLSGAVISSVFIKFLSSLKVPFGAAALIFLLAATYNYYLSYLVNKYVTKDNKK